MMSNVPAKIEWFWTRLTRCRCGSTRPFYSRRPRGGYIDGERFRDREWKPALCAAGIEHRGPKMMRHTFATWAIEDGLQLSHLATIMGTSIRELEDTYLRWLKRTDDQVRAAFDAYDLEFTAAAASGR
jgi:integrase